MQATDQWSREHLEVSKDEAAQLLLEHLRAQLGGTALALHRRAAHRWR